MSNKLVIYGNKVKAFKDRKKKIRAEAIRKANEAVREEYLDICRLAWELVRNDGEKIADLSRAAEVARTTIYNQIDEHIESRILEPDSNISLAWDVTKILDGEVIATSPEGDSWSLTSTGEAWNKTHNTTVYSFAEWPEGARDALDNAIKSA